MKLYVLGININKIDIATIGDYKFKETLFKYILSNEGIYQYTDNSFHKMIIIDYPCEEITINNDIKVLCDRSKFVTGPDWYQLPISCVEYNIKKTYYRLQSKALVTLVIETNTSTNKVSSFYFETSDSQVSHGIEEDIISFLKRLKIY